MLFSRSGELLQHAVGHEDILVGGAAALVFAPEDVAEFFQIVFLRLLKIDPLLLVLKLGLKAPTALRFDGTHLALLAFLCAVGPSVLVAHNPD